MLEQADVLVQNLAPGALDRLGLGREVLERDFPRLVAVSICGYGSDTPYAGMRAYDMLVQAESGVCAVTGPADEPCKVGPPVADICTGANAHAAILEALIERGRTGRGASIEISMFDGLVDWMTVPFLHYEHGGVETPRHGLSHATVYPYRPYDCADGAVIIAVQTNAQWQRLCREAMGRADLADRPEFASNALRVANRDALDRELVPFFAPLSVEEAIAVCDRAGIAWARYRTVAGLTTHPALKRMTVTLENGLKTSIPRPAGRDAGFTARPAPGLGADTDRLRFEFGEDP
jgi:crotonobetainyl-CoA:carnitine CoA-transferase CaiB-like acyl-CoA transferase